MASSDPERRGVGTAACFPVSREAASAVYRFLAEPEDHLDAHRQVMQDLMAQNGHVFNLLIDVALNWGLTGEAEVGFTGGMVVGYRALQEQAALNGDAVPTVSAETAATYAADLEQDGHATAGPYLLRRSDELEFEDPYYYEALRISLRGNAEAGRPDQGYMTCMAGVMIYDMVKKQAYADDMQRYFGGPGAE